MREFGRRGELVIGLLDDEEYQRYWPQIEDSLRGRPDLWETTTIENIKKDLDLQLLQLWIAGDEQGLRLVIMTQIGVLDNGMREFQMMLCFGQEMMKFWDLIVETFEDIAIRSKCPSLRVDTHRLGFVRLLEARGYRVRNYEVCRILGVPKGVTAN